jgi:hypothetical protein
MPTDPDTYTPPKPVKKPKPAQTWATVPAMGDPSRGQSWQQVYRDSGISGAPIRRMTQAEWDAIKFSQLPMQPGQAFSRLPRQQNWAQQYGGDFVGPWRRWESRYSPGYNPYNPPGQYTGMSDEFQYLTANRDHLTPISPELEAFLNQLFPLNR